MLCVSFAALLVLFPRAGTPAQKEPVIAEGLAAFTVEGKTDLSGISFLCDCPELYALTVTDASGTANDYANATTKVPDIIHFNSMRLDEDGDLVCSFRSIS